jgi:tetratricopeptide (TPR) repeat protein
MSDSTKDKETKIITNWRIAYKKKHGGVDKYLNLYKDHNAPFDYKKFKKHVDLEVSKGNIEKNIASQILKRAKEKDGTIKDVPIYESSIDYPILKRWSNEIEMAIPKTIKMVNDIHKEDFTLKQSPLIITKREDEGGQLDAGAGPSLNNNYYIEFDVLFVYFIQRIGSISPRLFDIKTENELNDIKKMMDNNLERDPNIYKYFRDVFYHFMFYGNKNLDDKNILKMMGEELFINFTGFLPPPDRSAKLFDLEYVITNSMGLFVMGHEYSHIIFDYICNDANFYTDDLEKSYRKEYHADECALKLAWNCMQNEFNQNPHDMAKARWCFIGVIIILNCFYIIDRMRGFLNGNDGRIIDEKHPPMEIRMKCIRQSIEKLVVLSQEEEAVFFDALDYIFQKLGDRFVDELSKNEYVLAYRQSKKEKIENLVKEVSDLVKIRETEYQKTHSIDTNINEKIIGLGEKILSGDSNNIFFHFLLGSIYLDNKDDDKALNSFLRVISISGFNGINGLPFDRIRLYAAMYHAGFILTRKARLILAETNGKPSSDQKNEIDKLFDKAISLFITASPHYHHDGMLFYELGFIYSEKKEHQKAVENFNKALEYQPNNPIIIPIRHRTIVELAKISGLTPMNFIIKAAKKGDRVEQFILGCYYESGLDVPIDLKKAFCWYVKSAKKGFIPAYYKVASEYFKRGNVTKADQWIAKAAKQNYINAQVQSEEMQKKIIK